MKQWIYLSLLILVQSCSEEAAVVSETSPTVVQTFTAVTQQNNQAYEFPAVVSAVKNVELRFEVAGRLIATNLVKGKKVEKGQVLAQIDPAPYERKVKDREVRHQVATNDLKRIQALYKKGGVSHSDFDNAKSLFETTLLDLNNAKQDLSYTKISAPFDGFVSDRYVENNSYVQVGSSIATIQDRSTLYFSFDVPERIMTLNSGNKDVEASARVIGLEDQVYKIHYVEHEAIPDPITQTYNVTFAIDNAQETALIPGSRAMVTIQTNLNRGQLIAIPVSAVIGDAESGFAVWEFNNSVVNKQAVQVAGIVDNYALISSGLTAGEKVVSAGTTYMREGLAVREYKAEK
ncbi:efflux RND transporter periplasmic adaptor subunit [Paraglaciecola aquimarina]|uniref:Efflux RND transporter periplasmic adaptor subunit n=1 Tax=Paraglaciecola algarum TaxID=3050085 RepID=A0ABS9D382_9ALTE|nr:efflux RND transporter periplasmic adaptor subunit [Paraglaciecola sp. G1-23]MCF2947386.1 efflux RND transporter periplasmic adaptor subunit [Paraglaciecola sp. G1-23]